ncbi:MAG: RluA family pseudouridine synthase [Clostridiales bacterium]|nr:RluA family pseudouridine synthase [Clostridiales bacterium]
MAKPQYRVIHHNGDTLAVEKAPGIPTTGPGSLAELVKRHYPGYLPCHRLDAMTGGVVLFAKGPAYESYLEQFRLHKMEKRYYAITKGAVKAGEYTHHLERDKRGNTLCVPNRTKFSRTAVARFENICAGNGLALTRCLPRTGRTHQLRVQLAALRHPILGDDRYGSREFNKLYGARYQALWSDTLIVTGEDGERLTFYSKPVFPKRAMEALGLTEDHFDHP